MSAASYDSIRSLCLVESASSDRPGLLRLADITPSGDLVRPDYERYPWT